VAKPEPRYQIRPRRPPLVATALENNCDDNHSERAEYQGRVAPLRVLSTLREQRAVLQFASPGDAFEVHLLSTRYTK
jgi:hypothetical protein